MKIATSLIAAAAIAAPSLAFAADWTVDASHSNAQFKVGHMMVSSVRGEFTKLSGDVSYDPKNPEKIVINAIIDASSINTREQKRDDHLKSPDFFDVAKHKNITFKSKSAKKVAAGKLDVAGDLTIKGVTKPVVLRVEGLDKEMKNPWGQTLLGGVATTKINRKDFGLTWNQALEAGGVLVGEDVEITIDVELTKKEAETAAK